MKYLIFAFVGLIYSGLSFGAKTDTLAVPSASMKKTIPTVIVLPEGYQSAKESYPVIYLLHGAGGSYRNWITRVPHIQQLADENKVIIVCPDGAVTSWYFDSPIDSSIRYETFVAKELPAYIDQQYKTIPNRNGRVITGLSMGGHGSLFLGFRHSNTFSGAGSMSGALHVTVIRQGYGVEKILGDTAVNRNYWNDWSVLNAIEKKPTDSLAIIIDCGVEDRVLPMNRAVHEKMQKLNIAHEYTERPGNHDWKYWTNAIDYQVLFFSKHFKRLLQAKK
ncbi:MAG: XynC protein [Chitinophaga sp.]|nr:XynC protein [Chitinophaga sp.]